ncbi:MAG: hypothetical protein JOZ27_02630 [Caulobacteraceae bacterium]|nr:hypothetical protein [Caulobacteraceae bacterium]
MRAIFGASLLVLITGLPGADADTGCGHGVARLNQRFVEDMRTKNRVDVLSLYENDASFIQPDGSTVEGSRKIAALYQDVFAKFDSALALQPQALQAQSGLGVCVQTGSWTETLTDRTNGKRVALSGRYNFAYRRYRSGRLRFARQQWFQDRAPDSVSR